MPCGERERRDASDADVGTRALPRLHILVADELISDADVRERLRDAAAAPVALHIRGRRTSAAAIFRVAEWAAGALKETGTSVFVNDRVDAALAAGAHGVHLREDSLPTASVRRLLAGCAAAPMWVGRSIHDPGKARAAGELADYLFFGSVFSTASHPGRTPAGLEGLRSAAGATKRPVIAIGGVRAERVGELLDAGAYGVAVKSAVWGGRDPGRAAELIQAELKGGAAGREAGRIDIFVNGRVQRASAGQTVLALLGDLGLSPGTVVVEHNRVILRAERLSETALGTGDRLEIVHFVGGG